MQSGFWRGLLAGGVLAALVSMIKRPERKASASIFDMHKFRRNYPRQASDRVIKEVTRTVSGFIKKK